MTHDTDDLMMPHVAECTTQRICKAFGGVDYARMRSTVDDLLLGKAVPGDWTDAPRGVSYVACIDLAWLGGAQYGHVIARAPVFEIGDDFFRAVTLDSINVVGAGRPETAGASLRTVW